MNSEIAQIALMFVLPLGVTFILILQSAAAEYRSQKVTGALLSLIVVGLDAVFYFLKNTVIAYNNDGGLLLTFACLFFLAILYAVRSDDGAGKFANILFAILMVAAIAGISYWERPTLVIKTGYTPEEIAEQNAKYQDYITSFQNGEGGKWVPAPGSEKSNLNVGSGTAAKPSGTMSATAQGRLERYIEESGKVIEKMISITESIQSFEPLAQGIDEAGRETRSSQALAISNSAASLNKRALGLFHPHESSEAHKVLIQASESLRLAAYSLYNYTLQEGADEQEAQMKQSRSQISQMQVNIQIFRKNIESLQNNYQQPSTENEQ